MQCRETFQVICIRYEFIFNLFNSPCWNKKQFLIHSTMRLRKKDLFIQVSQCRYCNSIQTEWDLDWSTTEMFSKLALVWFKNMSEGCYTEDLNIPTEKNLTALRQLSFERPSSLSCHFVDMIHVWSAIPERRLRNSFWTGWNLNPFLPFLFPRVCKDVILIRVDMVRVWEFHGTNEILAEHLQETQSANMDLRESIVLKNVAGTFLIYTETVHMHW